MATIYRWFDIEVRHGQCVVIVQFDLPKRTAEQAKAGGAAAAPTYRGLAERELISKHYLNGETGTGGVYVWESRAAAEAWYTEELLEQLARNWARPTLTWYDNHVVVDNVRHGTVLMPAVSEADAAE